MHISRVRRKSRFKYFISIVIIIFIFGSVLVFGKDLGINTYFVSKENNPKNVKYQEQKMKVNERVKIEEIDYKTATETTESTLPKEKEKRVGIINSVLQSVVGITTKSSLVMESVFSFGKEQVVSSGSGIILSKDGYILTNSHILQSNMDDVFILLYDGRQIGAEIIWNNEKLDLAIIKIEIDNLEVATIGDSSKVKVGESVFAIGNPLGFDFKSTVTFGIVSGVNRTVKRSLMDKTTYMKNLVQTDASINPGNSGGPLVNEEGEVIGINTIKVSSAEGIGFAIPINIIKPIIERLNEDKIFDEPYMGVDLFDRTYLPVLNNELVSQEGVYVYGVDKKSPAYEVGLRKDCLISEINGEKINTVAEFRYNLYKLKPKDEVIIKYFKNGIIENLKVKLENIKK